MEASFAQPLHPYYPLHISLPTYQANTLSVVQLLGIFFVGCAVILSAANWLALRHNPQLKRSELSTLMWFVLCGFIHTFFEGYFARYHANIASHQALFGQLWKEYALSDSRYLTSDPFVLCMETVTAVFWGPLSFCVALAIPMRHPLRHPLQLIVSLGQLYGLILYYATCWFNEHFFNLTYSRPEPFYYWGYYVLMNAPWFFVPLALMWSSVKEMKRAFTIANASPAARVSASSSSSSSSSHSSVSNGSVTKKSL